jgi:hypothetical protein
LHKAELAVVEICIQMGKIYQPLNGNEVIAIMNDMIRETEMSETLTEFQKVCTSCSESYGLVDRNWWQAFKKRHASRIVLKKGEKFTSSHADWTELSKIQEMYEYIYDEMIDASIASPHENPVYTDREGNESEKNARFGLEQEI